MAKYHRFGSGVKPQYQDRVSRICVDIDDKLYAVDNAFSGVIRPMVKNINCVLAGQQCLSVNMSGTWNGLEFLREKLNA